MNFDIIDGLSEEEILDLYENEIDMRISGYCMCRYSGATLCDISGSSEADCYRRCYTTRRWQYCNYFPGGCNLMQSGRC